MVFSGSARTAGSTVLDPTGDTFTHYRHDPADERSLSADQVLVIYQDRGGVLWVGTRRRARPDGPGERAASSTTATILAMTATLSNNGILSLHEDRRGNLWIGTVAGLNKLEKATGRFSRFLHDPANPHSLGHDYVSSIREDHSGVLWVGSMLRERVERPGREDRAIHALLLSRGRVRARRASPE